MEKPLISFILTYYNLPVGMLRECVESILALSLRNSEREIVIVDDGSTVSPLGSLKDYASQLIYIRQHNQGLSQARNTGLRMARGEYIQFVDGDDRLIQAPYEHCIDLIRFGSPDMVMFDFAREPSEPSPFCDLEPQSGTSYMRSHNIRGTACGYLFRRATLGNLRFTPRIWHEDEEFTPLLLLRAERVVVTSAKAYFYRERPDSIITTSDVRSTIRRLSDLRTIISRLNLQADLLPEGDRQALQRRVAQLTMDYLYNIIRQTRSLHYLERKVSSLSREGLFPLPDRDYTAKYVMFRRLTASQRGRRLLAHIIPLIHKER